MAGQVCGKHERYVAEGDACPYCVPAEEKVAATPPQPVMPPEWAFGIAPVGWASRSPPRGPVSWLVDDTKAVPGLRVFDEVEAYPDFSKKLVALGPVFDRLDKEFERLLAYRNRACRCDLCRRMSAWSAG